METSVFKSKVTRLQATKTRVYPSIRLPKEYAEIIGKSADVHPMIHEGKQAFLVVVDQNSLNSGVISPLEKRIINLENEIKRLNEAIFSANSSFEALASNEVCGCRDSNPGSRLGKPRS